MLDMVQIEEDLFKKETNDNPNHACMIFPIPVTSGPKQYS